MISKWIALRTIVCFHWNAAYWIPMFQFRQPGLRLRTDLVPVMATLQPVMGDWEIAQWFCEKNTWLSGKAPADLSSHESHALVSAASALRFAING